MRIQLFHRGEAIEVEVDGSGASRDARIGERRVAIEPIMLDPSAGTLRIDGQPARFLHERAGGSVRIAIGGECFDFELNDAGRSRRAVSSHGNPETRAPMPGKVLQVTVRVDDEVKPGDPLLILEAMKMENVLSAEIAGRVLEVHIKPGDMVEPGKLLVLVEPKD